jgi:uncharacterized repeat protein (TIGR03803 family)
MNKLSTWKTTLALCVFVGAVAISSPAQTFTTLANFDVTNGWEPYSTLVQGTDGNFYGTTAEGGANKQGNIFKITPTGTLTSIYSFCSKSGCVDGDQPQAGLVLASNGNFYGTTQSGGAYDYGTVFEITPAGKLTTLHSFCSEKNCADGGFPQDPLIQGTNGNLYGTTRARGANNDGTVFEITSGGTLTTLDSFDGTDGEAPYAGLVQASNGNFYGTTTLHGAYNGGTVFELTPSGKLTVLHSFDSSETQGAYVAPVQASNGNLYGTTVYSGGSDDFGTLGTVYEVTGAGTFSTLLNFDGTDGPNYGSAPYGPLIQATDGNLYGTTSGGGTPYNFGTLFRLTTAGKLTMLHDFTGGSGGCGPVAGLVQATNGTFYGTALNCGSHSDGTVFSLAVGLGPFVETNPTSGAVGTAVIILGNNLTGATSVTFNGTAATFKVVSSTEITTTVPKGATTGVVKVKTPKATLSSNVSFRVP